LKFYSSIRIDMRKIGNISESEMVVGGRHRAKIVKNKVAPPFRIAEFDIMNSGGISKSGSLVDVACEMGILEKSGSFFKYKGQVLAQGREALKTELEKNEKLFHEIDATIRSKIKSGTGVPRDITEQADETEA